jgi:hypothetical protein
MRTVTYTSLSPPPRPVFLHAVGVQLCPLGSDNGASVGGGARVEV